MRRIGIAFAAVALGTPTAYAQAGKVASAAEVRCSRAQETADPDRLFRQTDSLYVMRKDGKLIELSAADIVCGAAHESLRVTFQKRSSLFSTKYEVGVAPWSGSGPKLIGELRPFKRPDGVSAWQVASIQNLPGADGPLDTLLCLQVSGVVAKQAAQAVGAGVFAELLGVHVDAGTKSNLSGVVEAAEPCRRARDAYFR